MSQKPSHVAFILDGNRRWAVAHGLPLFEGHRRGYERLKEVLTWCVNRGIPEVSVWCFSTENWKRSKEEVGYLMDLVLQVLTKDIQEFTKQGLRLRVIGSRGDLSPRLQKAIQDAEEETKKNEKGVVNLCFNYGGRPEIFEAVKTIVRSGAKADTLTEEAFAKHLWSAEMSDIDLIVRTSGEQRLSGFQPWKGNYAELFFVEKGWPDFSEENLDAALSFFEHRERRFGGDGRNQSS